VAVDQGNCTVTPIASDYEVSGARAVFICGIDHRGRVNKIAAAKLKIWRMYVSSSYPAAQKENSGQQIVNLPDNLAVGADYGLTVISGSSP
jgi:hypothetical protein